MMNDREKRALAEFENGYNCAQAVILAFPGITGSARDNVLKLSAGFGGGMGRLQKTCGAVTGAFMVLGMKYGHNEPATPESKNRLSMLIQEFNSRFEERFGSSECSDLLGYDLNTEEGKAKIEELKLSEKVCRECILLSVRLIENSSGNHGE